MYFIVFIIFKIKLNIKKYASTINAILITKLAVLPIFKSANTFTKFSKMLANELSADASNKITIPTTTNTIIMKSQLF